MSLGLLAALLPRLQFLPAPSLSSPFYFSSPSPGWSDLQSLLRFDLNPLLWLWQLPPWRSDYSLQRRLLAISFCRGVVAVCVYNPTTSDVLTSLHIL